MPWQGAYRFVAGQNVAVLGRVTINLTASDITDPAENDVRTGGYLSLFGNGVTLYEAERSAGTNAYELLTGPGETL